MLKVPHSTFPDNGTGILLLLLLSLYHTYYSFEVYYKAIQLFVRSDSRSTIESR
jgi:hypothetical protein